MVGTVSRATLVHLLLFIWPAPMAGLDVSWTQYSDMADLPMSANWREQMRQRLLSMNADELSAKQKMQRKQLLRRLGDGLPQASEQSSLGLVEMLVGIGVLALAGAGILHFKKGDVAAVSKPRMGLVAAEARQRVADELAATNSIPSAVKATAGELAAALDAVLEDLGLETLEELGDEVVPAGKNAGITFREVLEDMAFCKFVCKEPRKGWMGMLKTYAEVIAAQQQTNPICSAEANPVPDLGATKKSALTSRKPHAPKIDGDSFG